MKCSEQRVPIDPGAVSPKHRRWKTSLSKPNSHHSGTVWSLPSFLVLIQHPPTFLNHLMSVLHNNTHFTVYRSLSSPSFKPTTLQLHSNFCLSFTVNHRYSSLFFQGFPLTSRRGQASSPPFLPIVPDRAYGRLGKAFTELSLMFTTVMASVPETA